MINWDFETMYAVFSKKDQSLLLNGKWGVEREMQRVTYDGNLALTPHPAVFGDKLMNKEITTDFSESQMELVTPACSTVEEVYHYLEYLYEKAEAEIGEEFLWPLSMPPRLPKEELIPIARFGNTEEGRTAAIYRQGLANRYGKKMQMISGIHFNFSFGEELVKVLYSEFGGSRNKTDFIEEIYFSAARNYLRYRWLLIYLFGASPSHDNTYDTVMREEVECIRKCCPECCNGYEKYATSLRVSRFGYASPEQAGNRIYFNSKKEYVQGIRVLLDKRSKKFAKLRVQLNDKILQKDSEFYSPIRMKQIIEPGESQLEAIEHRGVRYVEVRILDIDPFEKLGISLEQMHFLQVFMLFCLFEDNKPLDKREMNRIDNNHHFAALSGRRPNLLLVSPKGEKISLKKWGEAIFDKLYEIAKLLDSGNKDTYSLTVRMQYQKLLNEALVPSALLQEEMYSKRESFLEFGMRKASEYKENNNKRKNNNQRCCESEAV